MPHVVSPAPGVNPSQPTNRIQRGSQRCQWPGWRRCGAIPSVAFTNGGQWKAHWDEIKFCGRNRAWYASEAHNSVNWR